MVNMAKVPAPCTEIYGPVIEHSKNQVLSRRAAQHSQKKRYDHALCERELAIAGSVFTNLVFVFIPNNSTNIFNLIVLVI